MWKQLLKLRTLASDFLICTLGMEMIVHSGLMIGPSFGKLIDFLGLNETRLLGLLIDSKVAQAATKDGWCFHSARNKNTETLLYHLTTIQCNPKLQRIVIYINHLLDLTNPILPWV